MFIPAPDLLVHWHEIMSAKPFGMGMSNLRGTLDGFLVELRGSHRYACGAREKAPISSSCHLS